MKILLLLQIKNINYKKNDQIMIIKKISVKYKNYLHYDITLNVAF
jgi:hypothetical protein